MTYFIIQNEVGFVIWEQPQINSFILLEGSKVQQEQRQFLSECFKRRALHHYQIIRNTLNLRLIQFNLNCKRIHADLICLLLNGMLHCAESECFICQCKHSSDEKYLITVFQAHYPHVPLSFWFCSSIWLILC